MEGALVLGVVSLGVVHGVLPDHGWPIAAAYALGRPRVWLSGVLAGLVLGVGHLLSSLALLVAYFGFTQFAAFAEGPWMKPLAGGLLVLLGVREFLIYRRGDGHGHAHSQRAGHDHHHDEEGIGHRSFDGSAPDGGLRTLGGTAILLGFAHEEPVQILAVCAGTPWCLELMLVYSLAVIAAILAPTLLLIAGYRRHREQVERYTPYMPLITAIVLVGIGLGFLTGVL